MSKSFPRWLFLLLPFLILAPFVANFVFTQDSAYTDTAITFFPNALYVNDSIFKYSAFPLWSNSILSGYPFSADPQSGLWYPPIWLANLLPSAVSFNILIALHLILAGTGVFLLLKREGLRDSAALAGGLLFELTPKLWAHFGAGHISLVMAVCLTPWLLLAEAEFQRCAPSPRRAAYPGIVLGLIVLCNITWAPYALLIWIAYAFAKHFSQRDSGTRGQRLLRAARKLGWAFLQVILVLLISAPVWLPLITFSRLSSRALMTPADSLVYSMPYSNLFNLFIPGAAGSHEWVIYPGITALFFILFLLFSPRQPKLTLFWSFVIFVCLLISLGANFPPAALLYRLPLFNLLRVPSRFFFIACLGFAILAGHGVERFQSEGFSVSKRFRLAWAGFGFLISALSIGVGVLGQDLSLEHFYPLILCALSLVLLFLRNLPNKANHLLPLLIVVIIGLDVFGVDLLSLDARPPSQVLLQGAEPTAFLSEQEGLFRVYSPSYSLSQQTTAVAGLQLADGVNPLQLLSYVEFMQDATGIPVTRYAVTLPDFAAGIPEIANASYTPNARLLGLLNVRYIVSAFELPGSELELVQTVDKTYIYKNPDWLPRAWVQGDAVMIGTSILSSPQVDWSPNRISMQAQGPGLLVLSEITYPGWRVYVDGIESPLLEPLNLLRAVQLPSGFHYVEFVYQPVDVTISIVLAAAGWACVILLLLIKPHAKRNLPS